MGYFKAQKTRTHKRIVSIAQGDSRKGPCGIRNRELMKGGLTVGGSTSTSIRATA